MQLLHHLSQPVLCSVGIHEAPPPRTPHGPVVEICPCCRKWIYFYGLAAHGLSMPPSLTLTTFPRVLSALPPATAIPA